MNHKTVHSSEKVSGYKLKDIMRILFFILAVLIVTSCKDHKININKTEYKPLPALVYKQISPSIQCDCWMLMYNCDSYKHQVLYSSNDCNLNAVIENKEYIKGFSPDYPDLCYQYVVTSKDTKITYWKNTDSLRLFLGQIDNIYEAQFFANAFDYYSDKESVYKSDADGYELTLCKLVSMGCPIQTDRFLLHVSKNGEIKIIDREVKEKIRGGKI